MIRELRKAVQVATIVVACAACAPVLYNFGTVSEGKIYRSAQPSPLLLRSLARNQEIRSLVNLRGRTPGFESRFAAEHGLRLFSFDISASRPPTEEDVTRFLEIVTDPANQPVLVHCKNGVDRTGYMVALYRIAKEGWTKEQALAEMSRFLQFAVLNPVPASVVSEGARLESHEGSRDAHDDD